MLVSEPLWRSVVSRDAHADGLFVYAVTSTGIYCRPSCGSRKPGRDRVEFYPSAAMAEARGYRACRRCHPADPAATIADREGRVQRTCAAIAREPDAKWTSARLARAGGTSVVQLQRAFRAVLGLTPRDYVLACRRRRFLDRLREGAPVTDATYEAGFGSSSRMYGAINLPGMRPATYGRGGKGARIEWATAASPIGFILVAATNAGLCFVEVGDSVDQLVSSLKAEFPAAEIAPAASDRLSPMTEAARAVAVAKDVPGSLPIDIRGTAFQWRVWRALTAIPRGETRTYSQVAAAIGSAASVRAVARACATNPIALVVPCHRVIGADRRLHGYRWGVEVKQKLIDRERKS